MKRGYMIIAGLKEMRKTGMELVDGFGALRIVNKIKDCRKIYVGKKQNTAFYL